MGNDDKKTKGSKNQWILSIPFRSTVYLDFYHGSKHANAGFKKWKSGWSNKGKLGTTHKVSGKKIYGPGVVYEKDFDEGAIVALKGAQYSKGTYIAFVCPR